MSAQPQRLIIAMMDGLGLPGLQASPMPFVKQLVEKSFFREVKGVYPSVTNVNNVSIACGAGPPSTASAPTPTSIPRSAVPAT